MKKTSPPYVIGFMIVISILCGVAISFVHYSMRNTLDANARLVRNRTIAAAFNLSVPRQTAGAYDTILEQNLTVASMNDSGREWQTFTRNAAPGDVGFIFRGMGFWDMITGILVLSTDLSSIRSFEVIEQKETPGLGARIEEPNFKAQFRDFPLNWTAPEGKVITFGEAAAGSNSHRIDAITGATQTSMALETILNSELRAFRSAYSRQSRPAEATPPEGSK